MAPFIGSILSDENYEDDKDHKQIDDKPVDKLVDEDPSKYEKVTERAPNTWVSSVTFFVMCFVIFFMVCAAVQQSEKPRKQQAVLVTEEAPPRVERSELRLVQKIMRAR
jgi:hypothetical protein